MITSARNYDIDCAGNVNEGLIEYKSREPVDDRERLGRVCPARQFTVQVCNCLGVIHAVVTLHWPSNGEQS